MNEERKFPNIWKSLIRVGTRYAHHHHHISLAGYRETTLSPYSFMDLNNNNNNKQSKKEE